MPKMQHLLLLLNPPLRLQRQHRLLRQLKPHLLLLPQNQHPLLRLRQLLLSIRRLSVLFAQAWTRSGFSSLVSWCFG